MTEKEKAINIKVFKYSETHLDMEKFNKEHIAEFEKYADWEVFTIGLHMDKVAVRKISPNRQPNDITIKIFKVEDCDSYVYKALKTKIKAAGGAEGFVNWMIKGADCFECRIRNLLNYMWDNMKYECL